MTNIYSNGIGSSPFDLILGTSSKNSDIMYDKFVGGAGGQSTTDFVNSLTGGLSSAISSLTGGGGQTEIISTAGQSLGRLLSLLKTGEKQPSNVLANNPNLTPPKMTSKLGYGELQNYIIAFDQVIKKKVATFSSPVGGAGSVFNLIGSAGGGFTDLTTVGEVASQIYTGGLDVSGSTFVENAVNTAIDTAVSLLGVNAEDSIDITQADNMIPMVFAMSAVLSGQEQSPFTIDDIAAGWQLNTQIMQRTLVVES